eukprot:scaffold2334_cov138-Skeletonema_menzelii.AAC.7
MSASSSDEDVGGIWYEKLKRIKRNDPRFKTIIANGEDIQNISNEKWEELGRDIANNTHLTHVDLYSLNDQKMSFFFRGLTRSSSIKDLELRCNRFGAIGARSMVPFLQNANSLTHLDLSYNNIQSEGFNVMFRALSDSPIERLYCRRCGIESIDIDNEHIPRNLKDLYLDCNIINADGCRELAKLLQGGDSTLEHLNLADNKIDDEGVEMLVDALENNTSLTLLDLEENDGISKNGLAALLKLVNDISTIEATLRSNHTLQTIYITAISDAEDILNRLYFEWWESPDDESTDDEEIRDCIDDATRINSRTSGNLEAAGREKGELYVALLSSIAGEISNVNLKKCIQQERAYYAAKVEELDAKLALMEEREAALAAAENGGDNDIDQRCIKRRRK